jgi:hypothetical protein
MNTATVHNYCKKLICQSPSWAMQAVQPIPLPERTSE